MTGKLIFKMEMYKFLKDRKYLIAASVLGVLNIVVTLFLIKVTTTDMYLQSENWVNVFVPIMGMLSFIVFLANILLTFVLPYHILSIDYKNNVMAMMVASGVNRTKLFFSKVGAVLLITLATIVAVGLVPTILVVVKTGSEIGYNEFFQSLLQLFNLLEFDWLPIVVLALLNVLHTVLVIAAATILMKGSNLTILIYMGFNIAANFVQGLLSSIFTGVTEFNIVSDNFYIGVQIFVILLSASIFGFIALRSMQRQNL